MAYIVLADLETRFGASELTKLQGGSPNASLIAAAIADAEGVINAYLQGRYTIPISPVPAIVKKIACDIARYFLHDDKPSDGVKAAYETALSWLKDLAAGKITLDVVVYPATATAEPGYNAGVLQFSNLTGY